jgi:hypothetical protein
MGKYDEVIKNLQPLGETSRSERVENLRAELKGKTVIELSKLYAKYRKEKDAAEAVVKGVNEYIEAVCSLLGPAYEEQGLNSVKLADTGQTVSVQLHPHAVVEDRDEFRKWCIEQGLERQMQIPWQTADALTKACLLDGLPEPPGIKAYIRTKYVLKGK